VFSKQFLKTFLKRSTEMYIVEKSVMVEKRLQFSCYQVDVVSGETQEHQGRVGDDRQPLLTAPGLRRLGQDGPARKRTGL
jgi:hypothetical protein